VSPFSIGAEHEMVLKAQLYESAMEVLESLGHETMQAILWQMETRGLRVNLDSFDINTFAAQLQSLFGEGAESLLEEIYQNIICRMEIIDSTSALDGLNFSNKKKSTGELGALQKIQSIFSRESRTSLPRESGTGDNDEDEK